MRRLAVSTVADRPMTKVPFSAGSTYSTHTISSTNPFLSTFVSVSKAWKSLAQKALMNSSLPRSRKERTLGSMALTQFVLYVHHISSPWLLLTARLQSDNYWLNTRTPALTYGLRGISYYKVIISGPARDLHSGAFGRMVHEPMTDLIILMSKLVDPQGNILIPGIDEMVPPPDEEERHVFSPPFFTHSLIPPPITAFFCLSLVAGSSTGTLTTASRMWRFPLVPRLRFRKTRHPR